MANIVNKKEIYLEDYDVHVKPYLTYAEIQNIIVSTEQLEGWHVREQNIDMLLLVYATDIGQDGLEQYSSDDFLASGLIDEVKKNVVNFNKVKEGLDYSESTKVTIAKVLKELKNIQKKDVLKKNGAVNKNRK